MPIFLPAVVLGIVFVILGISILISRSKAGVYVERRFRERAQGAGAPVYVPGPRFVLALGVAITIIGAGAIVVGLTRDWPI